MDAVDHVDAFVGIQCESQHDPVEVACEQIDFAGRRASWKPGGVDQLDADLALPVHEGNAPVDRRPTGINDRSTQRIELQGADPVIDGAPCERDDRCMSGKEGNGLSVVGSRHAECIPLEVRHPRPVAALRAGGRLLDDHQLGIEGHRIGMAGMGRCHRRFFPTHAGLEGECTERIDAERAPPVDIVVRDLRRSAQAIECFGLLGNGGNARAPAGLDSGLQGQPC